MSRYMALRIGLTIVILVLMAGFMLTSGTDAQSPIQTDPNFGAQTVMVTSEYTRAASELPVPAVISRYKKCDYLDNFNEKMAARSETLASKWKKFRRCKIYYSGGKIPCFDVRKDEIVFGADTHRVWQYGQRFCANNDVLVRRLNSKASYFSKERPARVANHEVLEYYPQCHDTAVAFPNGSLHCKGTYSIVVVDRNHAVCAYGVWWTAGYLVGAREITVIPSKLFLQGVRCEGNHHIPS